MALLRGDDVVRRELWRFCEEDTSAGSGLSGWKNPKLWAVSVPQLRVSSLPNQCLFSDDRAAEFLAVTFAGQRRFQAALFAGRNIKGMALDFTNDVFLLYLTLEAAEGAFQRLVIAEFDFCQLVFTCLSFNGNLRFPPNLPDPRWC